MHGVEFAAGTVFAGYRIDRLLGRGGMGTVYLAAHPRLPRRVALKLLNRELYSDPEVRGRFEREADVSAHLDHPGIVSVLDRGVEDGLMWISMQYVDGTDASVFRHEPMDPARAVGIIAQTAEALDYAHERGVLHRDVKPANILLAPTRTGDRVLLTDFGIARLRGDTRQLTRTGAFLATLAYASPEQLSGTSVDHRSDQYSLACTLFTLLTGESPFPADNPGAVVAAHLAKSVPRASATIDDLPPAIDEVIARAMAKAASERFGSCTEFAHAATVAMAAPGHVSQDAAESTDSSGGQVAGSGGYRAGADDPGGVVQVREQAAGVVRPQQTALSSGRASATGVEAAPSAADTRHPVVQEPWSARTEVSAPSRTRFGPPSDSAQQTIAHRTVAVEPRVGASTPRSGFAPQQAAPQVRPELRSGPRPQRAVSSRWRVLAVSLIVLALVAGVGVIGVGAIYWKFVRPNRVAPPPNWGAHASVASGFTDLIPSGPTGRGWREASCFATPSLVVLPGDPVPLRQITCTDIDDRTIWYTEYPTTGDADAYLARHTTEDATRDLPDTSVTAYRPHDVAAPFTLAARAHGTSAKTVIEVLWPGHSFNETRDNWWQQAPF